VPAVLRILSHEFEADAAVRASDQDCRHGHSTLVMLNLFQRPSWGSAVRVSKMDPETSQGDGSVVCGRVMVGAEEVERDVGLVADDPAVVPRRNVEDVASAHLEHAAVIHCGGGAARDDHSDMSDLAGAC